MDQAHGNFGAQSTTSPSQQPQGPFALAPSTHGVSHQQPVLVYFQPAQGGTPSGPPQMTLQQNPMHQQQQQQQQQQQASQGAVLPFAATQGVSPTQYAVDACGRGFSGVWLPTGQPTSVAVHLLQPQHDQPGHQGFLHPHPTAPFQAAAGPPSATYSTYATVASSQQQVQAQPPVPHPAVQPELFRFRTLPPPLSFDDFCVLWSINEAPVSDGDDDDSVSASDEGDRGPTLLVGDNGAVSLKQNSASGEDWGDDQEGKLLGSYQEFLSRWYTQTCTVLANNDVRARLRIPETLVCPSPEDAEAALTEADKAAALEVSRRRTKLTPATDPTTPAEGTPISPGSPAVAVGMDKTSVANALRMAQVKKWSDLCGAWYAKASAYAEEESDSEDDSSNAGMIAERVALA